MNATSPVPGSFAYSPGAGTVLTAGSHTVTATFTPNDAVDYTSATGTVTIVVNPVAPTISWATPAAITFGTALDASQLNATAPIAGSFTYAPAAGTVLTAGSHTITATFTPTDQVNYTGAVASVTLVVSQVSPALSWQTPAAIGYGTPLGAAQLNATSSVAGSFIYVPPAGTVLAVGSQSLSATFIPTDTTDYSPATTATTLTVKRAVPVIALSTSANVVFALNPVSISATVSAPTGSSSSATPPTGSVSFYEGSNLLGTAIRARPLLTRPRVCQRAFRALRPNIREIPTIRPHKAPR